MPRSATQVTLQGGQMDGNDKKSKKQRNSPKRFTYSHSESIHCKIEKFHRQRRSGDCALESIDRQLA